MRRRHQIPCIDPGAGACEVSPPAAGGCSPTSTQVLFLRSRCDRPFFPFTSLGFQLSVLLSVSAAVALRLTKTLIPPQINRPFGRQGCWMGEELEGLRRGGENSLSHRSGRNWRNHPGMLISCWSPMISVKKKTKQTEKKLHHKMKQCCIFTTVDQDSDSVRLQSKTRVHDFDHS